MSAKKKIVSKVASVTESATPATINPVPTNVSAPPAGWNAPARLGRKGRRPRNGLTLVAPDLAGELRTNAAALAQELGPKAVDPGQLASALDTANGWDGVATQAATFHTYARAQRGASWDAAVTLMGGMHLGVRYALSRDATFADRFPKVAKAFAPRRRPKKGATSETTGATAPAAAPASPATAKPEVPAPTA